MPEFLSQLDVFFGDLTVNRAYVYARLPLPPEAGPWSLRGQVRGPRCLAAQTLSVTSRLVDLGPGPTLLARAVVLDPCFWSPDLPAIYDVTVDLLRGGEMAGTASREVGLRSLGVRGKRLALESKHWVLRGVRAESTFAELPRQWREASACYVAADPPADLLAEASQWGALGVAQVRCERESVESRLRELAQFPAVAIALIRGTLPADFQAARVAPNLLLAQAIRSGDELAVRPWADLLWAETDDLLLVGRISTLAELPVVACRRLGEPQPLREARAACDTLQRDLAAIGQFAGYVV